MQLQFHVSCVTEEKEVEMSVTSGNINTNKRFSGRQKAFLPNPPSSRASMIAEAIKVF